LKFARIIFGIAAVYGLIVLVPLYFALGSIGRKAPPAVTHPEFYYGFVGVAVLWQFIFILIALSPARYRPLMPIAVLEKFVYTVPVVLLYLRNQAALNILLPSLPDPAFGVLFLTAYLVSRKHAYSGDV